MANNLRNKGKNLTEFPTSFTVIDIETTGLSSINDEIIELSAIKVVNNEVVDKFSGLVKPKARISRFITSLTGITNEMVQNQPDITEVLPVFISFVADDCVLGHNVNFDINFIYDNLKKYFNKEFNNNYVDTMRLAKKYCKFPSHSLAYLAGKFEISTQGHHRALNDCMMTLRIYEEIKKIHIPE